MCAWPGVRAQNSTAFWRMSIVGAVDLAQRGKEVKVAKKKAKAVSNQPLPLFSLGVFALKMSYEIQDSVTSPVQPASVRV